MLFKRSLISELANNTGGVFTVLFTIVVAIGMVQILGQAAGGRIDNAVVFQMILYNALINLPPLLTGSLFVGVLSTMMRAWQDNEMVVWFSTGGRSLFSWVGPVLAFTIPFIFAIGLLSVVISPWARSHSDQNKVAYTQREDVSQLTPGRFIETNGGRRVFFIESAGDKPDEIGRLFLSESSHQKDSVVLAEGAKVEVNPEGDRYIVLRDGRHYGLNGKDDSIRLMEFDSYALRVDVKVDQARSKLKTQSKSFGALWNDPTPENQGEILWRLTWPIAALNLALLAVPLSCTSPRAGRSLNFIVAALTFILYLNSVTIVQTWVEQSKVGLWEGLWGLNGLVALIIVLLYIRRVYLISWMPPSLRRFSLYRLFRGGH